MTTTPKPATSPGLPTARGYFPPGTPGDVCINHNRACKTVRIAQQGLYADYDQHLTDEDITVLADTAGVREPGSPETRAAVRSALRPPVDDTYAPATLAMLLKAAAVYGQPFRYRTADGRTFFIAALPAAE